MKAYRIVPIVVTLAGIALPSAFTAVVLSKIAVARPLGSAAPPSNPSHHATPPRPSAPSSGAHAAVFRGRVVQGFFGPVQATLTVSRGKITKVAIMAPKDNPTSQYINSQAVPLLQNETLQAQSANINVVSGATVTSEAYYQSLVGALSAAHLS